jgi:LysM repeat protein
VRTLKTAFVVMGLLAVVYGAYVVINKPQSLPSSLTAFFGVGAKEKDKPGPPEGLEIAPPEGAHVGHDEPLPPSPEGPNKEPIRWPAPLPNGRPSGNLPGGPAQPSPFPPVQPPAGPIDPPDPGSLSGNTNVIPMPSPPAPPIDPRRSPALTVANFQQAWLTAEQQLAKNQLGDALRTLTPFYNNPDLHPSDRRGLTDLLDRLAGTVIYSKQHHFLAQPVKVRPGERLNEIADRYKLPWELLAQINAITDPSILYPGEELKVLPGPFQAVVNLETQEIVLTVADCYAGRFPMSLAPGATPRVGEFSLVRRLQPGESGSPAAGGYALDLGGGVTIFGDSGTGGRGMFAVSPRDASDLYCILTERKSGVVVRR